MGNKFVIALDAGHGKNTIGKRCLKSLDAEQTREWYLNDRIMDKVQEMLTEYDCVVIRTDDTTGNKDISLSARCSSANNAGANVFISMHHNAGLNGNNGGGTTVFHYGNAARQKQAEKLYNAVVGKTGLAGNRSQKVVKKNYYVLRHTKMAAFLIENGFMDSATDVPVILSESHARKTAEGVVDYLVNEYSLRKKNCQNNPNAKPQGNFYPAYKGEKTTLSVALQKLGIDYSYSFRKKIAAANGITGYRGTASQNTHMYNLLVAGILKKPN